MRPISFGSAKMSTTTKNDPNECFRSLAAKLSTAFQMAHQECIKEGFLEECETELDTVLAANLWCLDSYGSSDDVIDALVYMNWYASVIDALQAVSKGGELEGSKIRKLPEGVVRFLKSIDYDEVVGPLIMIYE